MKRNSKRISILLIVLILISTVFLTKPIQAVSTTLSASSKTVNSGASFSVTVSSSIKLSGWTIALSNAGGCTFSSISGGANDSITGTEIYGMNLNGTNTLATYNFKAPTVNKDTKYTITFSASGMDSADSQDVNNTSCSATITVKAKSTTSSSGSGNGGTSTTKPSAGNSGSSNTTKTPIFKSANKTVYTTGDVNLRASWSTRSSATLVSKGTELKLTGTSTEVGDGGYVWYRVTYKGATKYIASSLITETKPKKEEKSDNKNLSSLTIDKVELSPKFNKNTTEYTATVEGDVTELKINAKAEDNRAKVSIEGNKNLTDGENVIKIKVTAENDTTRTYFITVTKGEKAGTTNKDNETLQLSELKIDRVNFEETFKPDQYTYELSLNSYVKNLDITAVPNQEDAKVEITGNEEFKTGKNMVTILLTSADGKQTATYQIEVTLPEEVVESKTEMSTTTYIIIGVAVAVVIIGAFLFILHIRRKREEEFYYDEDEENDVELRYNPKQAYLDNLEEQEDVEEEAEEVEEVNKSRRKKSDVTLDDFLNTSDEEEETPKRRKGRHSK